MKLVDRLEMNFSSVKGYACICKQSDLVIIFEIKKLCSTFRQNN